MPHCSCYQHSEVGPAGRALITGTSCWNFLHALTVAGDDRKHHQQSSMNHHQSTCMSDHTLCVCVLTGYCQISCGRCSCCPSLQEAALQAGLTEFIWAMNRSSSHVEGLTQPGLLATLMAPNDNAMRTLFDKLGKG